MTKTLIGFAVVFFGFGCQLFAFDNINNHPAIVKRVVDEDNEHGGAANSLLIQAEGGGSFYEEVRENAPYIRLGSKDEDGWSTQDAVDNKFTYQTYMTEEMLSNGSGQMYGQIVDAIIGGKLGSFSGELLDVANGRNNILGRSTGWRGIYHFYNPVTGEKTCWLK